MLEHIVEMLEMIGQELRILDAYLPIFSHESDSEPNDNLDNAVVDIVVEVMKFWSRAAAALYRSHIGSFLFW